MRPVWETPCVNNLDTAHKGLAEGVQKEKPLVIRNDNHNNAKKYDNNAVFTHCMQSQKDAEKHDNKAVLTPCVNNSDTAHKGFAEGVPMWKEHKGLKPLVVRVKNFDSLSRKIKNPCSVINNFKLKEDILMRISKTKNFLITILMAALSLILLFSVSCSLDDKTGGGGVSPTSPEADSGGSGTGSGGGSGTGTEGGGSGTGSGSGTERNLSYYTGIWESRDLNPTTVIIQSNALAISNYSSSVITIAASNITRVSDTNYIYSNNTSGGLNTRFSFPTDTMGFFYINIDTNISAIDKRFYKK